LPPFYADPPRKQAKTVQFQDDLTLFCKQYNNIVESACFLSVKTVKKNKIFVTPPYGKRL